jgi:hypothetical protein
MKRKIPSPRRESFSDISNLYTSVRESDCLKAIPNAGKYN